MKASRLIAALAALAMSGTVFAQDNNNQETIDDSGIAPQALDTALEEFAERSGLQVIYLADVAKGKRSPGAEPDLSDQATLDQLLASTDLVYEFLNDNTVTLQATDQRGASDSGNASPAPILIAQNRFHQDPSNTKTGNSGDEEESDQESEDVRDSRGEIETIVVVGSRNTGLRRFEDDAQPYVVFDDIEIERSSARNLEEFFKTRLPMNTTFITNSQTPNAITGNKSSINLRGLGDDETLILVNGRRMPGVSGISNSSGLGQADINGIPLAAIERIEVLPSTASGIYGGGATGGAINIILKSGYYGADVRVGYESTFDSDASNWRIEGTWGFDLEDGRTSVLVSGSYSDASDLLSRDRTFAEDARQIAFQNAPEDFLNSFQPLRGAQTNICTDAGFVGFPACGSENLVLDDGTDLGSNITSVPVGYPGPGSDGGAGLVGNAGIYNVGIADDLSGGQASLFSAPRTDSISLSIGREMADGVEAYLDFSTFRNSSTSQTTSIPGGAQLDGDDPNNPFQNDISISYPLVGFSTQRISESNTTVAALGAKFRLSDSWGAQIEYSWNRARFKAEEDPLFFTPEAALSTSFIKDLNQFPNEYPDSLFEDVTILEGPYDNNLEAVTARLTGSLAELPGGAIKFSGLIEYRKDNVRQGFTDFVSPGNLAGTFFSPARSQAVSSAYAELLVPVFSPKNTNTSNQSLELQLSARHDSYRLKGSDQFNIIVPTREDLPVTENSLLEFESTDLTFGLRYSPFEDLILRTSFGTGFLPPSLEQIADSPITPGLYFLEDPFRPGENFFGFVDSKVGGNSALDPEESESWSAGIIYSPVYVPGLRLSVDYTRIQKTSEIVSFVRPETVFANEDNFQDRISRNDLTDQDIALGYTRGAVVFINLSALNLAKSTIEAYDFQINYDIEIDRLGTFEFYGIATYTSRFDKQATAQSESIDTVGFTGGPLQWRGNVGLDWQHVGRNWSAGWNAQVFDSYFRYTNEFPGATEFFRDEAIRIAGSETVGSQIYHDVLIQYRVPQIANQRMMRGAKITLGVQNIFNRKPPLLPSNFQAGGSTAYSQYGDPRLRRYSVSLHLPF